MTIQTVDINALANQAAEALPASSGEQRSLDIVVGEVAEFQSFFEGNPVVAVLCPKAVLVEVSVYRQLMTGQGPTAVADADCINYEFMHPWRYWVTEFLVAAPGFRLGEMVEGGDGGREFKELDLYRTARMNSIIKQTPVIYGQQMRARESEMRRLKEYCESVGWEPIQFGDDVEAREPNPRRLPMPGGRLALPLPAALKTGKRGPDYVRSLNHRTEGGITLSGFTITSADEERRKTGEFADFFSAQMQVLQQITVDTTWNTGSPELQARHHNDAKKMASSQTGVKWSDPKAERQQRHPVRAGMPSLTTPECDPPVFDFWAGADEQPVLVDGATPTGGVVTPEDGDVPFDAS